MKMPQAVLAGLALIAVSVYCGLAVQGQAETSSQHFQIMTPHDNDVSFYVYVVDTSSGHVSLCRADADHSNDDKKMKKPECSPWSE
jgi:hypothetical protein